MCGISGYLSFSPAVEEGGVIRSMMGMLSHRGPDEQGCYENPGPGALGASISLGHCRLKVIDLSESARQPLSNEDGTVHIVFNGEIYNFVELREELTGKGHKFRSRSDTEVIVHAYEEFGERLPERLDGMFAFAVWDERTRCLFLARDRTGKKPLFYHYDGRRFTFASEIKALLVCPWVERAVAEERLPDYFTLGYVVAPNTLYKNIYQLPPASFVAIDRNGMRGPHTYWRICLDGREQRAAITLREASEEVRRLVVSAVSRRLISDVPLGALLSGGIDSSIVVGIMSGLLKEPVRTFSIGFLEDRSFDESSYARVVAGHFKTRHTEFKIRMDAVSFMERLLWHHDQPYGDSAAIPTYLVCKLTREHVTVALNGDGSDEVFGGYDRFRAALIAGRIPALFWSVGSSVAKLLPRSYGYFSLKRRLERFFTRSRGGLPLSQYAGWISIFNEELLHELLQSGGVGSAIPSVFGGHLPAENGMPLLHQLLHLNFMTYLPDDLNVKMDRMSMANALETRSPFLDASLIDYAAALAPRMKIHRGRTKHVLRHAFRDLLPAEILKRPKHGFGMPLGLWFRNDLGLRFRECLLTDMARSRAYLDMKTVERLFKEHQEGASDNSYRLWVLLQFELWLRMLEHGRYFRPSPQESEIHDVAEVRVNQ